MRDSEGTYGSYQPKGVSSLMDMKKFKPSNAQQINTSNFIQTQNFATGSAKANYRDRANQNKAKNIGGFDTSAGFSVNSPFLSKTLKGMLAGPTAAQNQKKKKTSV